MSLWDMWIDGVPFRDPDGRWAIDGFEGAHALPTRKDQVVSAEFASGGSVVLGPYEVMPFTLTGWAAANTDEEAQNAVSDVLGRFGGTRPPIFSWEGAGGVLRRAEVRAYAGDARRGYPGLYRISIVCDNLWGAWYGQERLLTGAVGAPTQSIGAPNNWPSFRAELRITGAVTNPQFVIGGDTVMMMEPLPAGQTVRFVASPADARRGATPGTEFEMLHRCAYRPYRGALFVATGDLRVTAASGAGSWEFRYEPVLI